VQIAAQPAAICTFFIRARNFLRRYLADVAQNIYLSQKLYAMMKKILFLAALATVLTACVTQHLTAEEKGQAQAKTAREVEKNIRQRAFTVQVTYMNAVHGGTRALEYGYEVKLSGDTLYSYLPYFGRAYSVPYGGGKGLNFTAPISDYRVKKEKKGRHAIEIDVNNQEDSYTYYLHVHQNGATDIIVTAQRRDRISFSGTMVLP